MEGSSGMGGQAAGLIDHEKRFVFENDIEGNVGGSEVVGRSFGWLVEFDFIAFYELGRCLLDSAIYGDEAAIDESGEFGSAVLRQRPREKLVQPFDTIGN